MCDVVYINQYSCYYIFNNPCIDKISIFDYYYFKFN
nr:MAG TPA: hypothetical protein [Caudoviricetes sp.]